MNEVKTPKKNWFYYYTIVLLILIILNTFIMPLIQQHSVKEVDYGTFISMTEKKEIGKVEIESNQIVFTNKDESQIYKTGLMDDPNRTERLYESGAEFSSEIIEQMSPLVSFLLTWILPLVIFFAVPVYDQEAHEQDGRRQRFHDVWYGQEQRQDLCEIHRRHQILRCCR